MRIDQDFYETSPLTRTRGSDKLLPLSPTLWRSASRAVRQLYLTRAAIKQPGRIAKSLGTKSEYHP
jgi:hypothetical protein